MNPSESTSHQSAGVAGKLKAGQSSWLVGKTRKNPAKSYTPEYQSWKAMKTRCYSVKHKAYKDYGGRGITVCDRWLNSFDAFKEDMGQRPPGTGIERIDNNAGYFKENCKWADRFEQAKNKRTSAKATIDGKTLTLSEWSECSGVPSSLIYVRLKNGWDTRLAVFKKQREYLMTLDSLGEKHACDKSSGWHNYCVHYQKYLEELRDKPITMLEQGVQFGASMKMWAEYFHSGEIYGIDICNDFQTDNPHIHLFQLDQSDRGAWSQFMPGLEFDFICDDAGHYAQAQSVAFDCLWPRLKPHGIYAIEDVWVWPDPIWKQQEKSSKFLTQLIWWLNKSGKQYHGRPGGMSEPLDAMESSIAFIHFYPGLVILKKK